MGWMLTPELSKKCRQFVISHWGHDGLQHIKERPVTWVRHEANPHLKLLRRRRKNLPLITVQAEIDHIRVRLSTETKGARHA